MNCIFGGGRGQEGQINKYVWGYDEIIIFLRFGESFLSIWAFYGQGTDLENIFGVAKSQIFFLDMPDIPDIFGDKE